MQKEHRVIPMTAISTESNSIEASSALHPTDVMQAAMSVADRAPSAAAESDRNVIIVSGHRDHSMIASVTTAIDQIEIKDIKRVRVVMYRRMALDGPMVQAMDDRATDVRQGMTGEIEPMHAVVMAACDGTVELPGPVVVVPVLVDLARVDTLRRRTAAPSVGVSMPMQRRQASVAAPSAAVLGNSRYAYLSPHS